MAHTKRFFASKLNWLGILTALAGADALASRVPPAWAPWVTFIAGAATVILRTFATHTAIRRHGETQ